MIQALIDIASIIGIVTIFFLWIIWCKTEWDRGNYNLFWYDLVIGIIAQIAIWYKVMT